MRSGQATGLQIAFLLFAVLLLSVPLSRGIIASASVPPDWRAIVERGTQFVLGATLIVAFPALRRAARRELARPVPPGMRLEVAVVGLLKISLAFASTAVLAAWFLASEGIPGLERLRSDPDYARAAALSPQGIVKNLLLAVLIAPVVEELVCRGFLYRAFEARIGWFGAMLVTSAIFALYHPYFASAFTASIVYVCLLRRTGTLWAPIIVHAFFNLVLWWPILGQYVFPTRNLGEPGTWYFHAACALFVGLALPAYVWMSRDRNSPPPTLMLQPDGALQK